MRRIFDAYAYGQGPREGCWWDETCDLPSIPTLEGDQQVDVAIIGGGFTGISAALSLAEAGASVAVVEAQSIGWGASGRNGGFCCLGGGRLEDTALDRIYGREQRLSFRRAEKDAVAYVETLIDTHALEVDRHSEGETELAHREKDMTVLRSKVPAVVENYGVTPQVLEKGELAAQGMGDGLFFGALAIPVGFGLDPRKYLAGLVRVALTKGAALFENSEALSLRTEGGFHHLTTRRGIIRAENVIVATNGYSSEDLPNWLAGRYMPAQSTVLVTRPLSADELAAQGWTTNQMCYDTRNLLHYFRLMPDGRFLFGMRGGLLTGAGAETAARDRVRQHFETMFPNWAHVESNHRWSGLVNLARNRLPFVGGIPEHSGLWAAMCYHGNGVAMGTYAGKMVSDMILGKELEAYPSILQEPLEKFPLGGARRMLMPPLYAGLKLKDSF